MTRRTATFALVAALLATSTWALAQQKPAAPAQRHHPRTTHPKGADAGLAERTQAEIPAPAADTKGSDGGVLEARTLDGGTRVFRFGEVEIEGRLRNPQLVYFLRRVRAEFAAGDLGHRSFMRELSDTRHDPSF
jgi:hypothetical protein